MQKQVSHLLSQQLRTTMQRSHWQQGEERNPEERSVKCRPTTPESEIEYELDDEEIRVKKPKVDESSLGSKQVRSEECCCLPTYSILSNSLEASASTLNSQRNPSHTHLSVPSSQMLNGRTSLPVNLDAILSSQFSTSNNDIKLSYGTVEPTRKVTNGGDWTITWNQACHSHFHTDSTSC
jgi:hypothetical protein